MRAVVYSEPERLTVADVPDPSPGPGQVVVRPTLTGVCGTDLHLHRGEFFAAFPLTPGHEITGVVTALGDDVRDVRVGQPVVVDNASACGRCPRCERGEPLFCPRFSSLGVNAPGGFAEAVLVGAHKLHDAEGI